jgi:aminopeptidase
LLVEVEGHDTVLAKAIVTEAYKVGAYPFVVFTDNEILRTQLMYAPSKQIERLAAYDYVRMDDMDAYVLIRAEANDSELSDVPSEKMDQYWKVYYHQKSLKISILVCAILTIPYYPRKWMFWLAF